jgi:hypothetical protein
MVKDDLVWGFSVCTGAVFGSNRVVIGHYDTSPIDVPINAVTAADPLQRKAIRGQGSNQTTRRYTPRNTGHRSTFRR